MSLIAVDKDLLGKMRLAVFQAEDLTASGASKALEAALEALIHKLADSYATPADASGLFAPAREFYRAIGLDPTKHRPSSEALIRRVIRGIELYRINRIVDTCNLCSMHFALPIGLYDTAQVQWPAALQLGKPGEGYKGLGKDYVNVEGRWTLVDHAGPFGNPSSDSFRTRIRESTQACTFVIFAPASYAADRLEAHLHTAAERMHTYAGGDLVHQEIYGT